MVEMPLNQKDLFLILHAVWSNTDNFQSGPGNYDNGVVLHTPQDWSITIECSLVSYQDIRFCGLSPLRIFTY